MIGCGGIEIVQEVQVINICAQNPVSQFQPFTFTAISNGQTVFGPLPQVPLAIILLAITGTVQNPGTPDYALDSTGLNIVLTQGVNSGDVVYGMYQVT